MSDIAEPLADPKKRRDYHKRNEGLVKLLKKRQLNYGTIADACFCGRSSVVQVLGGSRKGLVTWNKLKKVMSGEELAVAISFANERLMELLECCVYIDPEGVIKSMPCPKKPSSTKNNPSKNYGHSKKSTPPFRRALHR